MPELRFSFLRVIHIEKVLDRVSSVEKGIVSKPDDLISLCGTHRWKERIPANCPLTSTHILWCMHTFMNTHNVKKKKLLKIRFFLIKEKTLGWFHPYYLLPAAPPPRTRLQLSRCVQAGGYWNTEEQGSQCVLGGESAEALGACEQLR